MAHIFYWSSAGGTNYFNDGHYLRLGTYESQWENDCANIKDGSGNAEGIYFYTDGKYTLKTTGGGNTYQEIGTGLERTVKNGNYSYTNTSGDTVIEQNNGKVLMEASGKIYITSARGDADSEAILIKAKGHDLYFQQAGYAKYVDVYKEDTITGKTHKTNIGIVVKLYAGANIGTYSNIGLSYKSATVGIKELSIGATGASLAIEGATNKDVLGLKFGFTIFATQIVWLHEEYEYYKNELKVYGRETKTVNCKSQIVDAEGKVLGVANKPASLDIGTDLQV
ncbi:hypothetical protein [Roseibium sp. M-1]